MIPRSNKSSTPAYTEIKDGTKTISTSGTAVKLTDFTTCAHVFITAKSDNSGTIVIGGSTVVAALATRRGTPLDPGDTMDFPINDLSKIYVDSTSSGDKVTFTYLL